MQAAGYAYAMLPVIKELYNDNDEQCRQLERHMQFYNCHPGASSLIMGADVALEESYETEVGDNLKVALMGPLAAIGDTIQAVLVTPPFDIIGAGLAAEGNPLSIFVVTLPLVLLFIVRWPLFNYGYKQGINVINDVSGSGTLDRLQVAASILGLTVVGGFIPSILGSLRVKDIVMKPLVTDEGEIIPQIFAIQEGLDGVLPFLIPIVLTAFCYWLIKVRKRTPLFTIVIIAVLAFILGALGIM
jgi:PTS system mannose-specific IID component